MTTYPFTPTGVADKLSAIYALTNTQIADQAKAVRSDCKAWLKTSFSFTSAQLNYLNDLRDPEMDYFGAQIAYCFLYKLQIELIYNEPPSPTGYGKYTQQENSVKVVAGPIGTTATGKLTFEMIYRPQ